MIYESTKIKIRNFFGKIFDIVNLPSLTTRREILNYCRELLNKHEEIIEMNTYQELIAKTKKTRKGK
jgi:hypothetical protein